MNSRLLLALVLGLASSQAIGAKARTANDWLQVEMAGPSSALVGRVYREQLLAWYRDSGTMDEAELKTLPEAEYFAFRPDLTRFAIDRGEMAGQWTFPAPQTGQWPDSAVQIVDRSDTINYRILARVYCDPAQAACRRLRDETAAMAPPEPPTHPDTVSYGAWRKLVEKEACTPGPKDMPAPPYPLSMARAGEGGRVQLQLLVNACGEVRAVRLSESSGYPLLDQSAITTAWRWRTQSERQPSGATVKVPVDFVPPPEAVQAHRIERPGR